MKHLFLFEEASGNAASFGVGTYIKNLIAALKTENVKITVCKTIGKNKELYTEYDGNIRYVYVPSPANLYADKRDYYTNVFFLIYPYIDKHEKTVFHFNYLNCLQIAKLLRRHTSAKILITIHYRQLSASEHIDVEKEFINDYCDKVIVLGNHAYFSLIKDFSVNPDKIVIVPNGIQDCFELPTNNNPLIIRDIFKISPDEKVISFVGRFDLNKNAALLVKAFLNLLEKHHSIRLVLAGSGDFSQVLKLVRHSWGKITFTGFLNIENLHNLYRITDIGVVPSIYEEFGYVAAEMMMHQIPIIANNTSGLAEIIEDGISGKLIDLSPNQKEEDEVKNLSDAIEELLDNNNLCSYLGINARKRFLEKYQISIFKNKIKSLYNSLFI